MPQSALRQIPTQSAEPFVRSYNPFNPAFRETMRSGITDLLGGRAMGGTPTQRYRAGMADMLTGAVDFVPGVGEAVGVADTVQAARGGNYGTAAILGGATMLGMLPVVGDVAGKAVRGAIQETASAPRNTNWLHGTDLDFQEFDMAFAGKNFNDASSKEGVFLSAQRGNAQKYGDNIMEVQDSFKNPKIINAEQDLQDEYLYLKQRGEVSGSFDDFINDFLEGDPYGYYETGKLYDDIKSAKSAGHDALIVDFGKLKMDRGGQFAVAFDPSTLKITSASPLEGTLGMSTEASKAVRGAF